MVTNDNIKIIDGILQLQSIRQIVDNENDFATGIPNPPSGYTYLFCDSVSGSQVLYQKNSANVTSPLGGAVGSASVDLTAVNNDIATLTTDYQAADTALDTSLKAYSDAADATLSGSLIGLLATAATTTYVDTQDAALDTALRSYINAENVINNNYADARISVSSGNLQTQIDNIPTGASDDLGNHLATQNLDLNNNDLINGGEINFLKLVHNPSNWEADVVGDDFVFRNGASAIGKLQSNGSATEAHDIILKSHLDSASGSLQSQIDVLPTGGDDLGNHTATQALNLDNNNLTLGDQIQANTLLVRDQGGNNIPWLLSEDAQNDLILRYGGPTVAKFQSDGTIVDANDVVLKQHLDAASISTVTAVAQMTESSKIYELTADDGAALRGLYYNDNVDVAHQLATF